MYENTGVAIPSMRDYRSECNLVVTECFGGGIATIP